MSGFDTGPGNGLMDLWIAEQRGEGYDADGAWAASAEPDASLLEQMLGEPYLAHGAPKSTGRELFHRAWIAGQLGSRILAPAVVQSTLCELTARSIAEGITRIAAV